ncbi:MAG: hypothetical protein WD055_05210 [Candidatus Dependentiae bacterium]
MFILKKIFFIGLICSTVTYAADPGRKKTTTKNQDLLDTCFTKEIITIPGALMHYKSIIKEEKTETIDGPCTNYFIGIASGPNESIAQKLAQSVQDEVNSQQFPTDLASYQQEALKKIVGKDITLIKAAQKTSASLFWLKLTESGPLFAQENLASKYFTIFPQTVTPFAQSVSDLSKGADLEDIKKYIHEECSDATESHPALVLKINPQALFDKYEHSKELEILDAEEEEEFPEESSTFYSQKNSLPSAIKTIFELCKDKVAEMLD